MGWGTPCRPCPLPGTSEFDMLCPHGTGMTQTGDDGIRDSFTFHYSSYDRSISILHRST
jgi:hypothetical protein